MKKTFITLLGALCVAMLSASAFADHHEGGEKKKKLKMAPHSVIHVVTVSWKDEATEDKIQAALDGVKTLAHEYDGIKRVWIKTLKAQGERSHAFVMEFKSEQALADYSGSEAQAGWYELYLPVRGRSTTFDITN